MQVDDDRSVSRWVGGRWVGGFNKTHLENKFKIILRQFKHCTL